VGAVSARGPGNLETFNLNVCTATDKELADTLKNLAMRLHEAYVEVARFSQDIGKIRSEQIFREEHKDEGP